MESNFTDGIGGVELWEVGSVRRRQTVMGHDAEEVGIEAEVTDGGTIVAVRVIAPGGVTAETMQRIPWERYFRSGVLRATAENIGGDRAGMWSGRPTVSPAWAAFSTEVRALHDDYRRGAPRPGRRGHPAEFYEALLSEYDRMVDEGEPYPVKAIHERLNTEGVIFGYGTVWQWVDKARAMAGRPRSGRRRGPTPEDLDWIAAVYRRASRAGVSYIKMALDERPELTKNQICPWKKRALDEGRIDVG